MNENELRSIEERHIQAVLGLSACDQNERQLVKQAHRIVFEPGRAEPPPPREAPTIHYTELPEAKPDSPLYHEWSFYRSVVGQLLAEGQEGRFLLIKGRAIIGIWDTHDEARAVALEKYLMQPCLIHQIRNREPLIRVSSRIRQCLS
jgi:hypothetical protein